MDHAMHLAAIKNIGSFQGTNAQSKFFLQSISNDDIIARTLKLGVSLGNSYSEIDATIADIKRNDYNRTMIMLKKIIEEKSDTPIDNNLSTLEHARLLAADLEEDEIDIDANDILNLTLSKIKKNRNF
jgi:hypothetical protein